MQVQHPITVSVVASKRRGHLVPPRHLRCFRRRWRWRRLLPRFRRRWRRRRPRRCKRCFLGKALTAGLLRSPRRGHFVFLDKALATGHGLLLRSPHGLHLRLLLRLGLGRESFLTLLLLLLLLLLLTLPA